MPITVEESYKGRGGGTKSLRREYVIKGATTEAEAREAFFSDIPGTIGTYVLKPADSDVDELYTNLFIGRAVWENPEYGGSQPEVGEFTVSFDISGENTHITQSLQTVSTGTAEGLDDYYGGMNFKGAIGVGSDGSVGGCDVIRPKFVFTLDYSEAPTNVNASYIANLSRMVGKSNDAAWKGFAAGELLLTRVSGSKRDEEKWHIQFGFAASEGWTDKAIKDSGGSTVFTITKKGWEYVWFYYDSFEDTSNNMMVKVPVAYFVEKVYELGDYTSLGLGT